MPTTGGRMIHPALEHADAQQTVLAAKLGLVFAANGVAWFSDVSAGQVVSWFSILAVGVATVVLLLWGRYNDFQNKARADRAKLDLEIDAARVRNELALRAEREKVEQTSLVAQLTRLQESVAEGNQRVEDANRKLHKQASEWEAINVTRAADMQELRKRHEEDTAALMRQLAAATQEIHELREENRAYRRENSELLRRLQAQADANSRRADDNSAKIEGLESKADALAGKVPPP